MSNTPKITLEEGILIAKTCLAADRNYREVAAQYNASYRQAYNCTKRYEEHGEENYPIYRHA